MALVIDDGSHLTDHAILDGLAALVDRVGHLVRLVMPARSNPALPLARWRSAGLLVEIGEGDLRFSDEEAITVASSFGTIAVSAEAMVALNEHVEGWPAGLHLALRAAAAALDPETQVRSVAATDRVLADYLVADVLDRLPDDEREVALALSVLDWFDAELCAELLGAEAVPIAHRLSRRRVFLTPTDQPAGAMRFHRLFGSLLEQELRWRDPQRREALHRSAAQLLQARGDLSAAYHHLVRIGDVASACSIVVPLALELVDRGDHVGLAALMRALPSTMSVDDPSSAFDLSTAWFFTGDTFEAVRWCDRGEQLIADDDPDDLLRLHATRALLSLMQGRIGLAAGHVASFVDVARRGSPGNGVQARFPTIGARVALSANDFRGARAWLAQTDGISEPAVVARVTVPALHASLELHTGSVIRASAMALDALAHAERLGVRTHHGMLEALLVGGWCRLATGDLSGADELAELAHADADELCWLWPRVRAGVLNAEIRRLRVGPAAALEVLERLRRAVGIDDRDEVASYLDAAEASALIACGRYRSARQRIEPLDDTPSARLLRARLAVASRSGEPIDALLADRTEWTIRDRLSAKVLLASTAPGVAGDAVLVRALELGDESGWVAPFIGHGDAMDRRLLELPLERRHPALAAVLRRTTGAARPDVQAPIEPLTPRELSILELLPTHLSYAEIGSQLYLSVNTIKSNIKATYRKLNVSSRAGAVDVAVALGLLTARTPQAQD